MKNRKWRDDAIRRADKRKARSMTPTRKPIRNSIKRFKRVMEDLYRKSLMEQDKGGEGDRGGEKDGRRYR